MEKNKKQITSEKVLEPYVFKKIKAPMHISYNNSYWLYNRQYFFKYSPIYKNDTGIIIGEVLVSHICQKLGVDCVECRYAINLHSSYEHRGVIVKNFLQEDEQSIDLNQIRLNEILSQIPKNVFRNLKIMYARIAPINTFLRQEDIRLMMAELLGDENDYKQKRILSAEKLYIKKHETEIRKVLSDLTDEKFVTISECERRIKAFAKENGLTLSGDIKYALRQMAIVDIVTKQTDRHPGNISLIYNKKQKTARIAPMYDNGQCGDFCLLAPFNSFPYCCNCYLKLENHDLEAIADKNTKIGKFYEKVKNFEQDGLDEMISNFKKEFAVIDSFRTDKIDKKIGRVQKREKDKYYWMAVKRNFRKGIEYLDEQIKTLKKEDVLKV